MKLSLFAANKASLLIKGKFSSLSSVLVEEKKRVQRCVIGAGFAVVKADILTFSFHRHNNSMMEIARLLLEQAAIETMSCKK